MIFKTERCIIKQVNTDDKQDLFSMCDDPNVWQYLGGNSTAEHHRKNIENMEHLLANADLTELTRWAIRSKVDSAFLGCVFLNKHHDGNDVELSYMLLSEHWGNGYASEAASEIIRYAFDENGKKLNRLVAETQSANLVSRKLLEKLGFQKIKELTRFDAEQTLYALDNPAL